MHSTILRLLSLTAASALALPTATMYENPSTTVQRTGTTHRVLAGFNGLHFEPENVVAEIGDVVEWHFNPANHSVAQSNFANPCKPLSDMSFFSGFQFATAEGQSPDVFQLVIENKDTIWYYCPQQKGNHCQNGMAGVINQNFDSNVNTLANYKKAAALTGTSVIPPVIQGGETLPNPRPDITV